MAGIGPISPIGKNPQTNNIYSEPDKAPEEGVPKENDLHISTAQCPSSFPNYHPTMERSWVFVPASIEDASKTEDPPVSRKVEENPFKEISDNLGEMGRIQAQKISELSELTGAVTKLCTQVSKLDENVKNLGLIAGVQTIRLENLLNMSILDTIRTFLPKILGGLRRIDIANRRLVKAQLDKLAWISQTVETYVKKALNPF